MNSPDKAGRLYPGLMDEEAIAILALAGSPEGTTLRRIAERLGKSMERCLVKIENLMTLGFLTTLSDPSGGEEIILSTIGMA